MGSQDISSGDAERRWPQRRREGASRTSDTQAVLCAGGSCLAGASGSGDTRCDTQNCLQIAKHPLGTEAFVVAENQRKEHS